MSSSDVLLAYHYADASDEVKALTANLRTSFSVLQTFPLAEVIKMTSVQLEDALLSCNSLVVVLSTGAFEVDKDKAPQMTLRKYLKLEINQEGSRDVPAPLIKPLLHLPRLLRRFIRSQKPVFAYELSGRMAPPASCLQRFKESYLIPRVRSRADLIKALISKGIKPNENVTSRPLFVPSGTEALVSNLGKKDGRLVINSEGISLHDLPDFIQDLFDSMSPELKKSAMRLLKVESVMSWKSLKVFEEVSQDECLEIPFNEVDDDQWNKTLALSWRWGHQKPTPNMKAGFTPMTDEQWVDLQALLHLARAKGMEHVWIDWSCGEFVVHLPLIHTF